ncbi:hypothetical protein [Paraburkholderia solitsugae]|nr:hypothetical protein [Paraburkholderia solitsugae]
MAARIAIMIVGVHRELSKTITVDEQRFAGNRVDQQVWLEWRHP